MPVIAQPLSIPFSTWKVSNMPAEVYNANPTLYAPSSKPTRKDSKRSIWFGDDEDDDSDSDQVELIDRDEVFGEHNFDVSFSFFDR